MSRKKREKMKAKERRHVNYQPAAQAKPRQSAAATPRSSAQGSSRNSRRRQARRWLGLSGRQWLWIGIAAVVVAAAAVLIWWFAVRQSVEEASLPAAAETPASIEEGERPLAKLTPSDRANYYSAPPDMQIDPAKTYTATIHTEKGDVTLELYADRAPNTINNFVFLANEGYYDNTTFHRVISGFMAQGGDPTGTGSGGPGYRFDDEFDPTLRHDGPGVLSMANSGASTNGSQFFITYAAQPHLDDKHSVFGRVIDGMGVMEQISPRDPSTAAQPGDLIQSITIEER
jgi:cyclophilin family peptidyl-prolyl cis-trans isomerase